VPPGEASAIARRLNQQFSGEDIHVIVPGPATITALQLVSAEESWRTRLELENLVSDFRGLAHALTERFDRGTLDEEVWRAFEHGPHRRFENLETGVVVEAHSHLPDKIDPYFLLHFAETAGHYPGVLSVCVHGFHDMCRLLELAGVR